MKAIEVGMDVYGLNPTNETGRYFRNNVWWWRPLADLCCAVAPDICAACTHWQSNDGDGLDADAAKALATVLRRRLADGTIARTVAERDVRLERLPDEPCDICGATGVRVDDVGRKAGMHVRPVTEPGHPRFGQTGTCNGCEGRGKVRPFETHYPCTVENVTEFADFLDVCGGFEIH